METFTTFIVREGQEIAIKIYVPEADQRREQTEQEIAVNGYVPESRQRREQAARSAICYFHGGGFSFGSIESYGVIAAGLAEHSGAVVASVQYRRIPENSYRSAQEDCYAALLWLQEHAADLGIDPSRIAVAGDSVGALLATISAAMARDRGGPRPVCQLLLYGAFALQLGRGAYAASVDPLLTPQRIDSFISVYRRNHDAAFYPSPLALEDLSRLPPAIMVAAEHDPLREEGLEYASRLQASGVSVEWSVAPGMIHGFLRAAKMSPAAHRELIDIARRMRTQLWADAASPGQTRRAKQDVLRKS
jgi:acetyl esterase